MNTPLSTLLRSRPWLLPALFVALAAYLPLANAVFAATACSTCRCSRST